LQKLVPLFWITIAGIGFTLLGLIGPWAKLISIVTVSISGFDAADGRVVAVLGLVAGVLLAMYGMGRRSLWVLAAAAVSGVLITVTAGYDLVDMSSRFSKMNSQFGTVSVGWGIYATVLGGIAIVSGSVLTIRESRRSRKIARPAVATATISPV
jgi:hypothetical protein